MFLLYRGESFDPNFYYRAGIDIDHAFLLIRGRQKMLIVPKLNESFAKANFKGKVIVSTDPFKTLAKLLRRKTVFADFKSLNAAVAQKLRRICKPVDYSNEFLDNRAEKKPGEVQLMARAAKYTREILSSLDFKSAKTELGLKKQLLVATVELGLEPAFDPIVSAGRNTSFPHYAPGNKKLNGPVLVDYGVRYKHYCADLTRCFILDKDRKKQYEKLQDVVGSIVDAIPDMKNGRQLASFADKLMKKHGFPKMIHSIGHGIGLDVHEYPRLSSKHDDFIAKTTFTLEPAFYLRNYGLRFEEMVHFDGKKARIL